MNCEGLKRRVFVYLKNIKRYIELPRVSVEQNPSNELSYLLLWLRVPKSIALYISSTTKLNGNCNTVYARKRLVE